MSAEPSCKKVKTNEATNQMPGDDASENDDQIFVAAPSVAQRSSCEILKLDVDCCEEIFEWLSIADLYSFGQTCKRMHRIAGMYFRQNYTNAYIYAKSDGIFCGLTRVTSFSEFVESLCFSHLRSISIKIGLNYESLKSISVDALTLNRLHLSNVVLANIESLFIYGDYPKKNILDLCPNLKRISVNCKHTGWLFKHEKFLKLEHISLTKIDEQVVNMVEFFNRIPNICSIEVNWRFFSANKYALLTTNVKLNHLIIDWYHNDGETSLFSILNELYECGFYKRLTFRQLGSSAAINQQWINRMIKLHGLRTLDIHKVENDVIWPVMPNVRKISINDSNEFNLNKFPSKVPNLQQIHLRGNAIEPILSFIRGSKQLTRIIWHTYEDKILNLSTLNKERTKLTGACKVIIYVTEKVFLETKFANGTNHSLVKIKRQESLKLNPLECWYFD